MRLFPRLFAALLAAATPCPVAGGSVGSGEHARIAFCSSRALALRTSAPKLSRAWLKPVLLGLAAAEREDLASILETANARWEARANPLSDDLEDGNPDEALEPWLSGSHDGVKTALAAARDTVCASDGFCVQLARPGQPCGLGFEPVAPRYVERARFLAWPLGHAVWLRAGSEETAKRAAERLRESARRERGAGVALVLDARTTADEVAALEALVVRHAALKQLAEQQAPTDADETLPFEMHERDVVVLPTVEALASREALLSFVRRVAPELQIVGD